MSAIRFNRTLALNGLHRRLRNPIVLVFLGMCMAFPLVVALIPGTSGFGAADVSWAVGLVLAAGMIGQDSKSGVLQLLLARPVTRAEYVVTRWLTASVGTAVISLIAPGLVSLVYIVLHKEVNGVALGYSVVGILTTSFGLPAALALFSSFLPGIADAGLWLVGLAAAVVIKIVGGAVAPGVMLRISEEIERILLGGVDLEAALSTTPIGWYALLAWPSTVVLCLALAIWIFNRREFSYASS